MHWAWIILGVALFVFAIWIAWDAFEHSGYGCAWLAAFALIPVISQAVYLFVRFYANRPDANPSLETENSGQQTFSRFPTEIEKVRFIEAADRRFGTMYDPGSSGKAVGYPHFRDDRADLLLSEGRLDEAWEYLIDLYTVAKSEADGRREDTYLHYISRLPDGMEQLSKWRLEQRLGSGSESDDDMIPPPTSPQRPSRRDIPF